MPINNQSALTTSINGLAAPGGDGFHELMRTLQAREFMSNPDKTVAIKALTADTGLNIVVPDMGRFALTDWSKSQLSTMLGLKFDKWFENSSPDDQAYELNRRFARAEGEVKLRTSLLGAEEFASDGTLQGIVSPSFSAVEDSRVAELVIHSLSMVEPEIKILRADITTRSTSFVVGIGRPFTPGDQREIGSIFGGIHIQNSGVGFASLAITLHLTRLVCTNGMTVPLRNAEILRRRHTSGLSIDRVRAEVGHKFREIPGHLYQAGQILQEARQIYISNVEDTIAHILQKYHLPKKLIAPLLKTFGQTPETTAFGVVQAMTDSQTLNSLGLRPEEKLQFEQAAGSYLQSLTHSS
ncbi:MAG: DUF945 domain-containing protein [Candidatus Riflebacteria bacterium]|nr:DUF945 domain-containing protein [Candidatus Riflebacteria bacterium]